jgi:hypothetical protein
LKFGHDDDGLAFFLEALAERGVAVVRGEKGQRRRAGKDKGRRTNPMIIVCIGRRSCRMQKRVRT